MKKILSVFLIIILTLTPIYSFAEEYDFIHISSGTIYSVDEVRNSPILSLNISRNISEYSRETLENEIFMASHIQTLTNQGLTFNEAVGKLKNPTSEISATAEYIGTLFGSESWDITIVGAYPDYVSKVVVNGFDVIDEDKGGFEVIDGKLAVNFDGTPTSISIYYGSREVVVSFVTAASFRVVSIDGKYKQSSIDLAELGYTMSHVRRSPSILRSILANISNQ